jgi:hypothetical protein
MNQAAYDIIRNTLLENDEDVALLKKVNRLSFGLMIAKEPETINNPNNNEPVK